MRFSSPRLASLLPATLLLLVACSPSKPIVKGGCQTNGDCTEGYICISNVCAAPAVPMCGAQMVCHLDTDCDSLQCGNDDGCCRSQCNTAADCTDTQECVNHVCREVGLGCESAQD